MSEGAGGPLSVPLAGPGPEERVLVLAPHLKYPLRNGADILIAQRWAAMSLHLRGVDLVGSDRVLRFEQGALADSETFRNRPRSRWHAGVRTVCLGGSYLGHKVINATYAQVALDVLGRAEYRYVVCSFLATHAALAPHIEARGLPAAVETHNDELVWFQHLRNQARSPFVRMTAAASGRWAHRYLTRPRRGWPLLLCLTPRDLEGYAAFAPRTRCILAPVGVSLDRGTVPSIPPGGDAVELLFVGDLSVRINADALESLARTFYPSIRQRFPKVRMLIAGRSPSQRVRRMSAAKGWQLFPEVSEDELFALFSRAHFGVLPFEYATGAKLKLLESLAVGVPVLATTRISPQLAAPLPEPSLVSDQPSEWVTAIARVADSGVGADVRRAHFEYAAQFGWARLAEDLHRRLDSAL